MRSKSINERLFSDVLLNYLETKISVDYALRLKEANNELILSQDGATSHTARYTKDKFADLNLKLKKFS
jgi:hypothetical protein